MKSLISKNFSATLLIAFITIFGCQKKSDPPVNSDPDTYSTLSDFYNANGVKSEFFTLNATTGGSFVSAKGTKITIKPNSFVDNQYNTISGTVKIEFKDIYSKSDMLMSNMPTMMEGGFPLKSAGEFYISASYDNVPINIANGKPILIQQPVQPGATLDTAMKPFVFAKVGWVQPPKDTVSIVPVSDSINYLANTYVFSFSNFLYANGQGTWANSDNPTFFAKYPQATLNIITDFPLNDYINDLYLVFKGINTAVHVYDNGTGFQYSHAPAGLPCTIVIVGVKGKKLYASFTDITISNNQTVHIPISEISTDDFKKKLKALD